MIDKAKIYSRIAVKMRRASDVPIKYASYMGDDYLVVPATVLVEGVHVGHVSGANVDAIFFPKETLNTNVDEWNTRPITLGHPIDSTGELIFPYPNSAESMEQFQLGLLFNARVENNGRNLAVDVWLRASRIKELAPTIIQRISNGEEIDVSADLTVDGEIKNGMHGNERYEAVARILHPKGLSLLLNEEGACSFMDGCGIRNRACQKKAGCTECKTLSTEEKQMADDKKNEITQDEGFFKGLATALIGGLMAKEKDGGGGGCGCNKEKKKPEDKPTEPKTTEEFLASAPEPIRLALQASLDRDTVAIKAHDKKLSGLRGEIMKLDESWKEDDLKPLGEVQLTKLKTALQTKPADWGMAGDTKFVQEEDPELLGAPTWPTYEN